MAKFKDFLRQMRSGFKSIKIKIKEKAIKLKRQKSRGFRWKEVSSQQIVVISSGIFLLLCYLVEHLRMHQKEKAKKIAIISQGIPARCRPSDDFMTAFAKVVYFLTGSLGWEDESCEKYSEALHVDVFVNPIDVVLSLGTRCMVTPIELMAEGVGNSLHHLLHKAPFLFQILIFGSLILCIILVIVLHYQYRIRFPLWFSFEPSQVRDSKDRSRSAIAEAARPKQSRDRTNLKVKVKGKSKETQAIKEPPG